MNRSPLPAKAGGIPAFEPHRFLRGGHSQTIVPSLLPGRPVRFVSRRQEVEVSDGDRLVLLESIPDGPPLGAAVLLHGLAGDSESPYIVRVADRLLRKGIRVIRVNLRGAGVGFGLARRLYNAGMSEDVRAVVEWTSKSSEGVALIGFSLGANLALKLAGEAADRPVPGLELVVAANPPVDLDACCRKLERKENRLYDRNFVKLLKREVRRLTEKFPDAARIDLSRVRTLREFDDAYTAVIAGFRGAEEYYEASSSLRLIPRILHRGLIIHAEDDPFIDPEPFRELRVPPSMSLELIPSGGHLGYFSRTPWEGDRRWLEARLSAWLESNWHANRAERSAVVTRES